MEVAFEAFYESLLVYFDRVAKRSFAAHMQLAVE